MHRKGPPVCAMFTPGANGVCSPMPKCASFGSAQSHPKNLTSIQLMDIRVDNLSGPEIIALLREHLRCMEQVSPPESRHVLNLDGLRKPEITFWTIWDGTNLAGCGALKNLTADHGEIKSMRTA